MENENASMMLKGRLFSWQYWSRRRVAVSLSVVILGVVLARVFVAIHHKSTARSRFVNQRFGGDIAPWKSSPQYTEEFNKYMAWLWDVMTKQRTPWTTPQVQRLLDQLNNPPDEEYYTIFDERVARNDPTLAWHDIEPKLLFEDTVPVIADRLRRNEPIEPAARTALINAILKGIDSPRDRIRDLFAGAGQIARLPMDPKIRAKYISIFGEHVMDKFDKIERLRAEGKWNEPWIK